MSEQQDEFLFSEAPDTGVLFLSHPLDDLFAAIAQLWGVPLGRRVRVSLLNHCMPELEGRLELARSPDLPLDSRDELRLRLGQFEFSHRQMASWALVES